MRRLFTHTIFPFIFFLLFCPFDCHVHVAKKREGAARNVRGSAWECVRHLWDPQFILLYSIQHKEQSVSWTGRRTEKQKWPNWFVLYGRLSHFLSLSLSVSVILTLPPALPQRSIQASAPKMFDWKLIWGGTHAWSSSGNSLRIHEICMRLHKPHAM